jgi:penicillin-binding protein 2
LKAVDDGSGWKPVPPPAPQSQIDIDPNKLKAIHDGMWMAVNEPGGTGGAARIAGRDVAGKTGTAQATEHGHEENVAWFAAFAPFDSPKYVVVVMVQGASGHGGEVAGPIATRIMERTLAMGEGNFDMEVAWTPPAHHPNPFQMFKAVSYTGGNLGSSDEESNDSSSADVQMASDNASPDVEQEPDAAGKVKGARVARAQPAPTPRPLNFFERLFGGGRRQAPQPTPVPARRRF